MSSYHNFVLTNEGADLLTTLLGSEGELEFRFMAAGSGSYMDEEKKIESIRGMTSLKEERQRTRFSSIKKAGNLVELKAGFNNQDVSEEYSMTEVGIYAGKRGAEASILYCVSLREGKADIMPDFSSGKFHDIIFHAKVGIGDTANPTIVYSRDVYALSEDLSLHIADKNNPHETDKEQVGLGEADNTSDMDKPVSVAQQAALDAYYQQSTGYTDTKISQLINGAPSTLDTLGEIAQAMQENEDVVGALNDAIGTKADQVEMDSLLNTKLDKKGDSKDAKVTFSSSDTLTPSAWTDAAVLKSGETHKSILEKVSGMFKNIRYLWGLVSALTAAGAITEVKIVDALPADAASHPTTFYWVKG